MVDKLLATGTVVVALSGIFLFIKNIFKAFKKIEAKIEKIDTVDYLKTENKMLVRTSFAICDGLIQLGANGPVTKCRDDLREYLIQRDTGGKDD
jgi:hypothetical protein